jgi:large subunit ribosomal protein L16
MLLPKRRKYKKAFKGRLKGDDTRGTTLSFGQYGLKALEPARITSRQIEATRRAISKKMKRLGTLWIRIFPDLPVTSKPTEVRMGKGKGSVDYWAARVKPGRILFELEGISLDLAKEAFSSGSSKLPIRTIFIERPVRKMKNKISEISRFQSSLIPEKNAIFEDEKFEK